nr:acyl-CoA thioesterase II [Propionibacterium sp.]
MPHRIDDLMALLELERVNDLEFVGRHPETRFQRSFGGQVMAQCLEAAYRTMTDERLCHSLSGYFLRPGSTDAPITYRVFSTRDGRGFSTRRVVAEQGGRELFVMASSFKTAEAGLEHQIAPYSPPAPPERCRPLADVLARDATTRERWLKEWGALDVRYVESSRDNPILENARLMVWVRTVGQLGDDPRLHQEVLAYLSDLTLLPSATVPHDVDLYSDRMQMATINHSMWFHRPIRADGWVLYDQVSPSASNGLGFSFGRLYAGGVLGASCAQEGLIRLLSPEDAASNHAIWVRR